MERFFHVFFTIILSIFISSCAKQDPATADNNSLKSASNSSIAISQIDSSYVHTCALSSDDTAYCWGENDYGKLGNGSYTVSETGENTPQRVLDVSNIRKISAGREFTCLNTLNDDLFCWGANRYGELATTTNIGTNNPNTSPVEIEELSGMVTGVSLGTNHACALLTDKTVKCWGYNYQGQLGHNTNTSTFNSNPVPTTVSGIANVDKISSGMVHTCVLISGEVKCWGGQWGYSPITISGLSSGIVDVSEGGNLHACALDSSGNVKCWGINSNGQLGTGDLVDSKTSAVTVTAIGPGAKDVATGNSYSCAIDSTNTVKCWGSNSSGQLGTGSTGGNQLTPVQVSNLPSSATNIEAGLHTCSLHSNNDLYCWGFNRMGQVGNGSFSEAVTIPTLVVFP